ncbi:DUF1153 domain-containing protein [Aerophototrophica crusticola]|uniref:DUF1153 domain-containing protein n=1 Tax=Aerophototrophica crusticola TaxID=1709002 RepID=A0A858R5G0_9PROT|nr:DUF1153 domain-containing protein [Rhodospirillaceae bacterium B3]
MAADTAGAHVLEYTAEAQHRGPARPTLLTLEDLPPPDTRRWVTRRKAEVVEGVRQGLITREEALARYQLSEEEFQSWERLIDRHGVSALRVTRLQDYRRG